MIELIRNCSHGSEIATYFRNGPHLEKAIIKVATTINGINDLKNEVEGWKWYQNIRYPHSKFTMCKIIQENEDFFKIEIEFIEGVKRNYRKGLRENSDTVQKVIEHYCNIWPCDQNGMAPIHGDLSIDNIINNRDGVHIVDWEHFNLKGGPWGFDSIYFLFETLWFGMRYRKEPTNKEIYLISNNIKSINDTGKLSKDIAEQPLFFIKKFISSNHEIWGKQLLDPADRFPIFRFSAQQIALIDRSIFRQLKS